MKTPASTRAYKAQLQTLKTHIAELEYISKRFEDNLTIKNNVSWGEVGDIERYNDLLAQVTDAFFKRGEHAE